jgi:hypothetical protein
MGLTKATNRMIEGASVNVKDFGVIGDGTTDDTVAFQAAITHAEITDAEVQIASDVNIKITAAITHSCNIRSNGGVITVVISDASTYPYALQSGGNVKGLVMDGVGSVTGVGAIQTTAAGLTIEDCSITNFYSMAVYALTTDNYLRNLYVNLCGRYPDKASIYTQSGGTVESCTVKNSRYKALVAGQSSTKVSFLNNRVEGTTGAASEPMYFSYFSTDGIMQGNTCLGGEPGNDIKVSKSTERHRIIDNNCEGGIFSQGGTDNLLANNIASSMTVASHITGSTLVPDTGARVINNVCTAGILIGVTGLGEVNNVVVKGNKCTAISGYGSFFNSYIDSNVCTSIFVQVDKTVSAATDGPVYVTNNVVNFASGVGVTVRGALFGINDELLKGVVTGNYIEGPGSATASTVGINCLVATGLTIENNIIEACVTGVILQRLRQLSLRNNTAKNDVTDGYSLLECNSGTYWPGSDFVVENNLGTLDYALTSRIPTYYLSEREKYAGAAPTTGWHKRGEYRLDSTPTAGGTMGWVCTTDGTPGTWKTFGAITA